MTEVQQRSAVEDAPTAGLFERDGARAKCSFLLSVLANETSTAPERAVACLALADDIEGLAASLEPSDLADLRDALDEALGAAADQARWTATLLPDAGVSGADNIDGVNVSRVVVRPDDGAPTRVPVGRLDLPGPGRFAIASECTFVSDQRAVVEVLDIHSKVLASTTVPRGHNGLVTATIDVDARSGTPLTVVVANYSGDADVLWYGATIEQVAERDRSIRTDLTSALVRRRDPASASVLTPVTGEPLTLSDVDRLSSLCGRFRGERIFIMGNGPSLNRTPLDLLKDDYVFGVNRVSLLFDRISWRPTFFTAFDVRVVPDNQEEFAQLDVPYKFFSARYKQMMGERENHYWHHTKGFYEGFEHCFEPTVVYSGFGGGGTIGVVAIELAWFMGFREIYLIGTDVSYSVPSTVTQSGADQFGDGVKLELQSKEDDDNNHFDPRYFGAGKKWHNPNVREMKIGFARAAAYIARRGGVLRNATVGGELDEVERVDFESLF